MKSKEEGLHALEHWLLQAKSIFNVHTNKDCYVNLQGQKLRYSKCRDIQGQTGTDKDRQGHTGTDKDKQKQAWTDRDQQEQAGTESECPCLSQLVPVCPCLSLLVPACPWAVPGIDWHNWQDTNFKSLLIIRNITFVNESCTRLIFFPR